MTDKYAVIGNPISHSKSPEIHTMFAEQFKGQPAGDMVYEAIEVPIDGRHGFEETIEKLRNADYKGCNVTVPFKQKAFQLSPSVISGDVTDALAANTLIFLDDAIQLENTDGTGLVRDLKQNLKVIICGKRLLLIGAGGAARGVLSPLRFAGAKITITNRTADKARFLANRFSVSSCSFDELVGKHFDIVINATSSGLTDEMLPLPDGLFNPGALAYDMMYGRETPFMAYARKQGAAVVADGLGMLVEQAAEAFFLWRNVRPDTKPVLEKLRK
jgi:shikimate dehydrogenase